jgi:hypothetical protein
LNNGTNQPEKIKMKLLTLPPPYKIVKPLTIHIKKSTRGDGFVARIDIVGGFKAGLFLFPFPDKKAETINQAVIDEFETLNSCNGRLGSVAERLKDKLNKHIKKTTTQEGINK